MYITTLGYIVNTTYNECAIVQVVPFKPLTCLSIKVFF